MRYCSRQSLQERFSPRSLRRRNGSSRIYARHFPCMLRHSARFPAHEEYPLSMWISAGRLRRVPRPVSPQHPVPASAGRSIKRQSSRPASRTRPIAKYRRRQRYIKRQSSCLPLTLSCDRRNVFLQSILYTAPLKGYS